MYACLMVAAKGDTAPGDYHVQFTFTPGEGSGASYT